MRVLIVDDEPLVRRGLRAFLADEPGVTIVGECRNGDEAEAAIRDARPDVVFLDIQMPERDGLELIARVGVEQMPAIVFVTAFDQYAVRAFDLHAVDYLLKPFDRDRLRVALGRVRERLRAGDREGVGHRLEALLADFVTSGAYLERIAVRAGAGLIYVRVEEVDWIEAADNYLRLHAGRARHLVRETLRDMETKLDPHRFARVHRSAIVNLSRVAQVEPLFNGECAVRLTTGQRLTLSRTYRDAFHRRMARAR